MNNKNLKVGDKVFIRENLVHLQEYGNAVYYKVKGSGERTIALFHNDNKDTFFAEENGCYYTAEMIDWEKTIELRREKMKNKDLKVGDMVYIREDLEDDKLYGANVYIDGMCSGVQRIKRIHKDRENFKTSGSFDYFYTPEMIDWEKTAKLNNLGCFKKITQFGVPGAEITKGITYAGKEIVAKNNNEENDIEKAVMLLMLKSLGVTYSDVKREVEKVKVKWMPKKGEKYYWINPYFEINWRIWQELRLDRKLLESGDCFKTEEEAEEKVEKIKEIIRGE